MALGEERQVVPRGKVCERFRNALDHLHGTVQNALGEAHHGVQILLADLPLRQALVALPQVAAEIERAVAVNPVVGGLDFVEHGAHFARPPARNGPGMRRTPRTRARSRYCSPRACRRRRLSGRGACAGCLYSPAGLAPQPLVGARPRMRSMARCRGMYAARYWFSSLQPPGFGAQPQQRGQEIQVRQRLRQLKAELRVGQVRLRRARRAGKRAQGLVVLQGLQRAVPPGGLEVFVVEVRHFGFAARPAPGSAPRFQNACARAPACPSGRPGTFAGPSPPSPCNRR